MTRVGVPYADYKIKDVQNVVHIFVEDVDYLSNYAHHIARYPGVLTLQSITSKPCAPCKLSVSVSPKPTPLSAS